MTKEKQEINVQCEVDKSILRTGNRRYRTTSLFYEHHNRTLPAVYTILEEDKPNLPSAYKIYMSSDTEYEAAIRLVGSWEHWQNLLNSTWFMRRLEKWREERRIRELALAQKVLLAQASKGSVTAANSIKAETKGRPSKKQVKEAAQNQADRDNIISMAKKRLESKGA